MGRHQHKPIQDASNAYAETMVEAVLNVTYTLISEVNMTPALTRRSVVGRQSTEVNARLVAEDEKRGRHSSDDDPPRI